MLCNEGQAFISAITVDVMESFVAIIMALVSYHRSGAACILLLNSPMAVPVQDGGCGRLPRRW